MDFDAHERATTISVDDIVTYCQNVGYLEEAVQPSGYLHRIITLASLTLHSYNDQQGCHDDGR
jgi:hypothetical protein